MARSTAERRVGTILLILGLVALATSLAIHFVTLGDDAQQRLGARTFVVLWENLEGLFLLFRITVNWVTGGAGLWLLALGCLLRFGPERQSP